MAQLLTIQGKEDDITTLKKVLLLPPTLSVSERSKAIALLYENFYRLMFLTRRKVWFKNVRKGKIHRIILVASPHRLTACDKHFLHKHGYPIDGHCGRDSCFQCNDIKGLRVI